MTHQSLFFHNRFGSLLTVSLSLTLLSTHVFATPTDTDKAIQSALAGLNSVELAKKGLVSNPEAPIPPQCYTRTEGQFNPCYTCHQTYKDYSRDIRSNFMRDGGLQGLYEFSDIGTTNHWQNLFKDRRQAIAAISDEAILSYINSDNYSAIVNRKKSYDYKQWAPDLKDYQLGAQAFDAQGHAKDGSHWVAFNYKPLPSTFWPTNGSTDDVLLRLAKPFRENAQGHYQRDIYQANLALLEMNILGLKHISTPTIDETVVGHDLNNDQKLSAVDRITQQTHYVGAASHTKVVNQLYPQGTEFMHSVRYLGIDEQGHTVIPPRMKELRYMKKISFKSTAEVSSRYLNENLDKVEELLPKATRAGTALDKGFGWVLSAYIEDMQGKLRPQTYEETFFCTGCHSAIGSTIDHTFAFARKLPGAKGWGYIDLKKLYDAPNRGEQQGEYVSYLERVGGGSEFRNNEEMQQRWFTKQGRLDKEKASRASLFELITPSKQRALTLNKAYKVIVDEQSFHHGRDATVTAPKNVYQHIDNHTQPLEEKYQIQGWDIRPDWR